MDNTVINTPKKSVSSSDAGQYTKPYKEESTSKSYSTNTNTTGYKKIKRGYRTSYLQKNPDAVIDYKKVDVLMKFMTDKGKILPRKITNLTSAEQRKVSKAIRRARAIGLLPFCAK